MTRDEAKAECARRADEDPDRATHSWIPRETASGEWSVVRVVFSENEADTLARNWFNYLQSWIGNPFRGPPKSAPMPGPLAAHRPADRHRPLQCLDRRHRVGGPPRNVTRPRRGPRGTPERGAGGRD